MIIFFFHDRFVLLLCFVDFSHDHKTSKRCTCLDTLVVLPKSNVRQGWDVVVVILLLYTLIFLPLRVAFQNEENESLALDIVIDVLFFMDILMSFVSAYRLADGTVIRDFDTIAKRYLQRWFIMDVIATFPFYAIGVNELRNVTSLARIPRLLRMFRLLRLMKLLRAYRLKKLFEKIEYSPKIHQGPRSYPLKIISFKKNNNNI